jgi:hypothetical protein
MTIFYWLRFKNPPTWRATSPYLYCSVTWWPSYTPRHWVHFLSPPTTRRAMVEVFEPAFTQGWLQLKKKSQIHIATVSQSISKSRCQAPSGAHDQIVIILWQLLSCFCGAPTLTRRRVCLFYMLLALASVVFLRSESLWTHDHILLSQI